MAGIYKLTEQNEGVIRAGFDHLRREVVESTTANGWREGQRSLTEGLMLVASEVFEAFEGGREKPGLREYRLVPETAKPEPLEEPWEPVRGFNASPAIGPDYNCVEDDLADTIIRIIDEADRRGLDVVGAIFAKARFNRRRAHRHGGKVL